MELTVCSTTHRVLSPPRGAGPRFSIPFFQGVSYDATFDSMEVPEEVKKLRQDVLDKNGMRKDDIEFTFSKNRYGHLGEATLMNRIKSHPDVGERWVRSPALICLPDRTNKQQYPDQLKKIRDQQARDAQKTEQLEEKAKPGQTDSLQSQARTIEAH